jgi:alginate O-acetyltransferase complex protein AlgI
MGLGGLWHGANWTFVVWGAWQGAWLIFERNSTKRAALGQADEHGGLYGRAPRSLRIAWTFVLVMIGWVLFRSETIADAGNFLIGMAGLGEVGFAARGLDLRAIHLLTGLAGAWILWGQPTTQELVRTRQWPWVMALQIAFLVALMQLHHEDQVPFLYFQF